MMFAGTSGLVLPVPNKLAYPPEFRDKSRLAYYASLFNSIEINSSFYKVPMAATVQKWAESVPGNFRFTFKLWREITHNKLLAFREEDVYRFMSVIDLAGSKKGCLLVQFPASITIAYIGQLQRLLSAINQADLQRQWKIAVEFRSMSWYQENTYELLTAHHAGMVLHDMPASLTPFIHLNPGFVYLRFHGPGGGYRGSYADDLLYEYGSYINEWLKEGKDVYVYFNNTMGEALKNLVTLKQCIAV